MQLNAPRTDRSRFPSFPGVKNETRRRGGLSDAAVGGRPEEGGGGGAGGGGGGRSGGGGAGHPGGGRGYVRSLRTLKKSSGESCGAI